jgi:hypothetical protein
MSQSKPVSPAGPEIRRQGTFVDLFGGYNKEEEQKNTSKSTSKTWFRQYNAIQVIACKKNKLPRIENVMIERKEVK